MKVPTRSKLILATETLRTLTASGLRRAVGGTVLIAEPDPIPAPKTDPKYPGTQLTYYTCTCNC